MAQPPCRYFIHVSISPKIDQMKTASSIISVPITTINVFTKKMRLWPSSVLSSISFLEKASESQQNPSMDNGNTILSRKFEHTFHMPFDSDEQCRHCVFDTSGKRRGSVSPPPHDWYTSDCFSCLVVPIHEKASIRGREPRHRATLDRIQKYEEGTFCMLIYCPSR
jgi:hypothetical protein